MLCRASATSSWSATRTAILTYCSPSVFDALGYQPAELEGTHERDLIHASDVGARDDLVSSSRPGGPPLPPIELRMHDRDGEWHWFETIEINRLDDPDVKGIVTNARDVDRPQGRERANCSSAASATRSPVSRTGSRCWNGWRSRCHAPTRSRDIVAVLFCDLDDFKLVNDGYGHDFADGVLVEVARRLERLQRKSDTVARIGGDEFVVVCDGLHDIDESTTIASRIRDAIARPDRHRRPRVPRSPRASGSRPSTADLRERHRSGDAAAQRRCRDVPRQAGGPRALAPLRRRLVAGCDATIRAGSRSACPRSNAASSSCTTNRSTSSRATRSSASRRSCAGNTRRAASCSPDQFLEIAEQTGMIVPIGAWAMRAACAQARQWRDAGWPGWMSVNLSPASWPSPASPRRVARMLDETGVDADRLWLELSESVLMRASPAPTERADDPAGRSACTSASTTSEPGTRSLPRLQQLPTDFVKIDGELVANLTVDGEMHPPGCDMVAALVQVGTTLGLSVIADGIETRDGDRDPARVRVSVRPGRVPRQAAARRRDASRSRISDHRRRSCSPPMNNKLDVAFVHRHRYAISRSRCSAASSSAPATPRPRCRADRNACSRCSRCATGR